MSIFGSYSKKCFARTLEKRKEKEKVPFFRKGTSGAKISTF